MVLFKNYQATEEINSQQSGVEVEVEVCTHVAVVVGSSS